MKVFNSLKAYEEIKLFDGGQLADEKRIAHETYTKGGFATEPAARYALAECMAAAFVGALSLGPHQVMFNRVGPTLQQDEDGLWSFRWRAGFAGFEQPEFTWAEDRRYPA